MKEDVQVIVSVGTSQGFVTKRVSVEREGPADFWERLHQLAGREAVTALQEIERVG